MRIILAIAALLFSTFIQAQIKYKPLGSYIATDTNKIAGSLWVDSSITVFALKDEDSLYVVATDANGKFYLKEVISGLDTAFLDTRYLKKTDTSRSGTVTTYYYVDSLIASIPIVDLTGLRDTAAAAYDTFASHWAQIYANYLATQLRVKYSDSGSVYVSKYGVDTAKSNLRASISGKISYSDTTGFLPTKTFLAANYLKHLGNSFGATAVLGTKDRFGISFLVGDTVYMQLPLARYLLLAGHTNTQQNINFTIGTGHALYGDSHASGGYITYIGVGLNTIGGAFSGGYNLVIGSKTNNFLTFDAATGITVGKPANFGTNTISMGNKSTFESSPYTGIKYQSSNGWYYAVRNQSDANIIVASSSSNVLIKSGTDRGTGALQVTNNVSVLGTNSSNTYRWDAASGSTPSNTATPAGWVIINVNGAAAYLPYYQ